jgi:NifU-like protein
MGREALQAAVANYRGEAWKDDHDEGALICKCFAIDEVLVEETIRENNLRTVEEVTNYTKAGGGCSACHEGIEGILTRVLAENGEMFIPAAIGDGYSSRGATEERVSEITGNASLSVQDDSKRPPAEVRQQVSIAGVLKRIRTIEAVLEKVRPALRADKGDVELVEVDGKTIYVHLTGACSGCQMAAMTLGGIQQQLIEALGEFVKVLPDTEMPVALEGA